MLQNPDRHAGFVVLKAADIPSVLVEMGFMSNPKDEAALRRPDHRKLVAEAMRRAVDAYFAGIGHVAGETASVTARPAVSYQKSSNLVAGDFGEKRTYRPLWQDHSSPAKDWRPPAAADAARPGDRTRNAVANRRGRHPGEGRS